MYEASYGYPPDDPDEVLWISLSKFTDAQGVDPKKWTVKPYCPHCKIVLQAYDVKATKGVYLLSEETDEDSPREAVGFKHPPGQAKKDCPYSYANDPRYNFPPSRHTAQRERARNRERLRDPRTQEALQEVLRRLMLPLTKQPEISSALQKELDALARKVDRTQGLAEHLYLRPYMQVLELGDYLRPLSAPDEMTEKFRKGGRQTTDRIMTWRPNGIQILDYTSVNGERRRFQAPRGMRLCLVYEQADGITKKYVQARENGKRPIVFAVSRAFAAGFVKQAIARGDFGQGKLFPRPHVA